MARPYRAKRWRQALPDPAACWLLSRSLGVLPPTAQVLYNRGLTTPAAAAAFLSAGREQILDPFLLRDMDRAVALIRQRIRQGQPIMVYGDYDADGVTGTAVLVLALQSLGAKVEYYIPNRFSEGYGLNLHALQEIRGRGYDFILSVDTGVSAVAEAEAAKQLGVTLLISDHHEPGPVLPDVPALINPKRPDCSYPFKGLSGVGVAFKLALALEAPGAWDLIDIVTLGTIADMVPLVGENRAIVREGLAALGATRRPGLQALMQVAGVRQPVTAVHIGFALGPRINALGRMGSAMLGVELITTEDPMRAAELSRHLDQENQSRQEVEAVMLEQALQQAEQQSEAEREHVLVLAGEGWHHGVVGICASRVLEAYHRPVVLLAIDGDEVRGSARSIPTFHMYRALSQVSDLFAKFGGHAAAAGMTLRRKEDVPLLRSRLNRIASEWLRPEDLVPELRIDAFIEADQLTDRLVTELAALEPHGIGNPAPLFGLKGLGLLDSKVIGKEQNHLKLLVKGSGLAPSMDAVGWNLAPARPGPKAQIQVAGFPEYDTYRGRRSLRITMRDVQVIDQSGGGVGVQMAEPLTPSESCCLCWDPLDGTESAVPASADAPTVDARDDRLVPVLSTMLTPVPEVAASGSSLPEDDHGQVAPEPTRLLYLQALTAPDQSRLLVLTASPWAAATLATELQVAMADRRAEILLWLPGQPEPGAGRMVVAPYGAAPMAASGTYSDIVLYHPPYCTGQIPPGRRHLLWVQADWSLAEASLGWPYPDRESLKEIYRLIRSGQSSPELLASVLAEPTGPWNRLRWEGGSRILREIGLLDPAGSLIAANGGAKFDLETSSQFLRGMQGRAVLAKLQATDWPTAHQIL